MKDLRMRAWHRKYRKMFDVVGVTGIGDAAARVMAPDTQYPLTEVDIMHSIGQVDTKNERIYEGQILEFILREDGKEAVMMRGRVVFLKGCFRLMYDRPINANKVETVALLDPDWREMRIVANIYEPNLDLKRWWCD
jgi:hypothetical protein